MGETAAQSDAPPDSDSHFVGHILIDVPAPEPAFGFKEIARALADIIQNSEPPFAVGVFGSWGSGKSTLMDAIAGQIDTQKAVVVPFNAWRYEREPHLILPLLDTIRASLSAWADNPEHPENAKERARDIAGRIGTVVRALARGFSAQIGVPGAVAFSFDTDKALDALSSQPEDVVRTPQSLYFAAFQELTEAFQEVEQAAFSRIVVFVDDPGSMSADKCADRPRIHEAVLRHAWVRVRGRDGRTGDRAGSVIKVRRRNANRRERRPRKRTGSRVRQEDLSGSLHGACDGARGSG
jgi:energy-coupling factor transporter ATP-binding protein EcfA2